MGDVVSGIKMELQAPVCWCVRIELQQSTQNPNLLDENVSRQHITAVWQISRKPTDACELPDNVQSVNFLTRSLFQKMSRLPLATMFDIVYKVMQIPSMRLFTYQ